MNRRQTDLDDVDSLAKQDRDNERGYDPGRFEGRPTSEDLPGRLNRWRAFHMLWRLGLTEVSPPEAEAALRENWPETWRTNEEGNRFGDEWFSVLATYALREHGLRRAQKPYRA
jgi:hypothetical protein